MTKAEQIISAAYRELSRWYLWKMFGTGGEPMTDVVVTEESKRKWLLQNAGHIVFMPEGD